MRQRGVHSRIGIVETFKDFKRLVRARMHKTGESYTAARARLLSKRVYEATKSKVFGVPLARLYRAWSDARLRTRWLPGVDLAIRSATRGKYMRITWPDRTSVAVGFTAKGAAKSQVQVQHGKLADKGAAVRLKEYWAERLGALGEVLAPTA